jgi:hypothetical protein
MAAGVFALWLSLCKEYSPDNYPYLIITNYPFKKFSGRESAPPLPTPWPEYPFYIPIGVVLSLIAFVVVSLITRPIPEERLQRFFPTKK